MGLLREEEQKIPPKQDQIPLASLQQKGRKPEKGGGDLSIVVSAGRKTLQWVGGGRKIVEVTTRKRKRGFSPLWHVGRKGVTNA